MIRHLIRLKTWGNKHLMKPMKMVKLQTPDVIGNRFCHLYLLFNRDIMVFVEQIAVILHDWHKYGFYRKINIKLSDEFHLIYNYVGRRNIPC